MINLWDYGKKQWLDKQFFKGVQVSVVYAAGPCVLLQHESDFALITHEDDKLQLLWQQHFPALNVPKHEYRVSFSYDRQAIVFELTDKIIRVDTQTGEQTYFPRAVKSVEGELAALSPAFNYRVSHYFDPLRLTECLEYDQNSSLYSVDGKEKLQTLVGTVFAISPDGKVLATCKGKELRLYREVAL
ncbi:MAG: hypothetical protein CR991_03870 [Proteobacteria bacterium]|nr:MAG: hypothetical protein CR991_03870 [Pseudomonadota bacterium]